VRLWLQDSTRNLHSHVDRRRGDVVLARASLFALEHALVKAFGDAHGLQRSWRSGFDDADGGARSIDRQPEGGDGGAAGTATLHIAGAALVDYALRFTRFHMAQLGRFKGLARVLCHVPLLQLRAAHDKLLAADMSNALLWSIEQAQAAGAQGHVVALAAVADLRAFRAFFEAFKARILVNPVDAVVCALETHTGSSVRAGTLAWLCACMRSPASRGRLVAAYPAHVITEALDEQARRGVGVSRRHGRGREPDDGSHASSASRSESSSNNSDSDSDSDSWDDDTDTDSTADTSDSDASPPGTGVQTAIHGRDAVAARSVATLPSIRGSSGGGSSPQRTAGSSPLSSSRRQRAAHRGAASPIALHGSGLPTRLAVPGRTRAASSGLLSPTSPIATLSSRVQSLSPLGVAGPTLGTSVSAAVANSVDLAGSVGSSAALLRSRRTLLAPLPIVVPRAPVFVFRGHIGWVNGVAVSDDGTRVASCGADNSVQVRRSPRAPVPCHLYHCSVTRRCLVVVRRCGTLRRAAPSQRWSLAALR
jgi:hypothetical protein